MSVVVWDERRKTNKAINKGTYRVRHDMMICWYCERVSWIERAKPKGIHANE